MNQLASRTSTSRPSLAPMVGLVVVGVVLVVGAQRLGHLNSDELGALITVTVLLVLTIPLAVVLGRLDNDPGLTTLLLAAFAAKMVGAYVRYTVLYDVYEGLGDAARYYDVGLQLAQQFEKGNYVFGEITGTHFMEILSGFAYTVLPESELAGFVFFAWIAFLGLILFSRAIRIALPDADHRRYDLLLFFLPTLVFWPSSIGKEAWMVAVLGLASYGAARLFAHHPSGVIPLGFGLWGTSTVRPHLALMVLAALAPAWLARPTERDRLGLSPYFRAFGFGALILVLLGRGVQRPRPSSAWSAWTAKGPRRWRPSQRNRPRRGDRSSRTHGRTPRPTYRSLRSRSSSGRSCGRWTAGRVCSPRPKVWRWLALVRPLLATTRGSSQDDRAQPLRAVLLPLRPGLLGPPIRASTASACSSANGPSCFRSSSCFSPRSDDSSVGRRSTRIPQRGCLVRRPPIPMLQGL